MSLEAIVEEALLNIIHGKITGSMQIGKIMCVIQKVMHDEHVNFFNKRAEN